MISEKKIKDGALLVVKIFILITAAILLLILPNNVKTAKAVDGQWTYWTSVDCTDNGNGTITVSAGTYGRCDFDTIHRKAYLTGTLSIWIDNDNDGQGTWYTIGSGTLSTEDNGDGTITIVSGSKTVEVKTSTSGSGSARPDADCYFYKDSNTTGTVYYSGEANEYTTTSSGTAQYQAKFIISYYTKQSSDSPNGFQDGTVEDQITSVSSMTISKKTTAYDPLSSYEFYIGGSLSASGRLSGNYQSGSRGVTAKNDAGKRCNVTYETEGGKSASASCTIPDAATLSYSANGGSGSVPSSETVWVDSYVTIGSATPTRTNYTFLGWSTSSSYTELAYNASAPSGTLTAGSSYYLTHDTTLYAVWRQVKVPYTLNITINGQNVSNDFAYVTGYVNGSTRVSNGRSFSALEIPGYNVRVKVKSSDNGVYVITGNSTLSTDYEYDSGTKTISGATTDTVACGTIHTITYNANGGTYGKDDDGNELAGPEDQTRYYSRNLYLTSTVPTRVGYEFVGWKSNRTGITFSAGGLYGTGSTAYSSWMRGGTETMVAQWEVMS